MDQVHVVRHKVLVEGVSVRRVAAEMGVSRNTVRRYLDQAEPVYGPRQAQPRQVMDRVGPRIEALLAEAPRLDRRQAAAHCQSAPPDAPGMRG
jgi:transposase-like protein